MRMLELALLATATGALMCGATFLGLIVSICLDAPRAVDFFATWVPRISAGTMIALYCTMLGFVVT